MSQLLQFYKSFQQARLPAQKAAPTFEDLSIDDKLTEHQRVVRYVKSAIGLQRLFHVKMISDVAKTIGFPLTLQTLIPLLDPLIKDAEHVVRQHLVEQLKHLSKIAFTDGGEEGYRCIRDKLLPLAAVLLEDEKQEVRQSASLTIVEMAKYIRPDDIGQHVLTIILRLAHDDDKEDYRMTAAQLLNLLAETMGQDLCRQFIIPEVVSLSEDPVFRVRKSTALNFHFICKVGGEHELLERLMPAFVRLSKDDMYRVRRACAESLSEISKHVSDDIRLGVLVEIFLRLAHDPSKLVKQSILQQSGMFIATLPPRAVNEAILSNYTSMVTNPTGEQTADNELKHICAYSFPAVLQVMGRKRWGELRELYHTLTQNTNTDIKHTLACSLHEVARILGGVSESDGQTILVEGQKFVEEELLTVFEDLLQEKESVQIGLIKHIAEFLKCLPALCRLSYLPILREILHSTNPFNWRLRQYLAVQLVDLVELPPPTSIYRTLYPTIMTLLQDPVASVRCETFRGVTAMLVKMYEVVYGVGKGDGAFAKAGSAGSDNGVVSEGDTPSTPPNSPHPPETISATQANLAEAIATIVSFTSHSKYMFRMLYMELCVQLLRDVHIKHFERDFLPSVLKLSTDRIFQVRLAVSNFLVGWSDEHLAPWEHHYVWEGAGASETVETSEGANKKPNPWRWLLSRKDINEIVKRLSRDDKDIVSNLSLLQPLFPDVSFTPISVRGLKVAPGGAEGVSLDATQIAIPLPAFENTGKVASAGGSEKSASMTAMPVSGVTGEKVRSNSITSRGRAGSFSGMAGAATGGMDEHLGHIPKLVVKTIETEEECVGTGQGVGDEYLPLPPPLPAMMADELDIIDGLKSPPHRGSFGGEGQRGSFGAEEDARVEVGDDL